MLYISCKMFSISCKMFKILSLMFKISSKILRDKTQKRPTSPCFDTAGFKGKYHINSRWEKYIEFLLKFLREISYKIA